MSAVCVYIWSPGRAIRLLNGAAAKEGANLAEVGVPGAEAILLVAHRASLIRQVPVPAISKDQVSVLLRSKLAALLPAGLQNYVSGFRLSETAKGQGRNAIVGCMKAESLRKLQLEAKEAGMRLTVVAPAPLAVWIAARAKGVANGLLVTQEGSDLCFDLISDGELAYTRFTAGPLSDSDMREEAEQTCMTAGVPLQRLLTIGEPFLSGVEHDPHELDAFTSDAGEIRRLLFSFELPEQVQARQKRKLWGAAQRALAASLCALLAWGYLLAQIAAQDRNSVKANKVDQALATGDEARLREAESEAARLHLRHHLINLAFDPAQTYNDVVAVVGRDSDSSSWLTGFSLERGKPMSIRGQATDGKSVTKLVARLSKESRFRNVKLLFATKGQLNNEPVIQFAVQGFPIGNLPFDQLAEPEASH